MMTKVYIPITAESMKRRCYFPIEGEPIVLPAGQQHLDIIASISTLGAAVDVPSDMLHPMVRERLCRGMKR